ncbi:MAG: CBS domain-containing protein [Pseudomonadota bacterium]
MYVSDLTRRNPITVRPTDDVVAAAHLMREHHIGYLVVVEADFTEDTVRPIGVLTDRDIVLSIVARGVDPRAVTVKDIMTANPVTIMRNDSVVKATQEMRRIGVRRLPVVGSLGELDGVLSLDDVLDAISGELQNLAGAIHQERRIESSLRP